MNKTRRHNVYFDSLYLPSANDNRTKTYNLYPFKSHELIVMFVYGSDFQRDMNKVFTPKWLLQMQNFILLFISLAALFICIIRKKLHLQHDDIVSSLIDIGMAFIGGGDLRMRHKIEKWFFGVLMIGAFFIAAMWIGDLLLYNYQDKKISAIDQLPKMNLSAYTLQSFGKYSDIIRVMLRLE